MHQGQVSPESLRVWLLRLHVFKHLCVPQRSGAKLSGWCTTSRSQRTIFVYRARFNAVSGRTYRGDKPFKDRIKFMFCSQLQIVLFTHTHPEFLFVWCSCLCQSSLVIKVQKFPKADPGKGIIKDPRRQSHGYT